MEMFDLRAMIAILHYMENLFAHYDSDVNDILDTDELWKAFPLLKPLIRKLGNGYADYDAIQRAIFSYLLVFAEPPQVSIMGGAKLLAWSVAHHGWRERADRLDVLNVIASVNVFGRQEKNRRLEAYHVSKAQTLRTSILSGDSQVMVELAIHAQCLPEAAPLLVEVLRLNIDRVAPPWDRIDPKLFVERIKGLIRGDSRFDQLCLPF
jgi:hypothetical protein